MSAREANLQQLIDLTAVAVKHDNGRVAAAAARVFDCLAARQGEIAAPTPRRFPVCFHHLDAAYASMAAGASPLPELAAAFSALEGRLTWQRRKGAASGDQPFFTGHANAMLIGPGGIEQREDVWVGVSLLAPGITYPDHSHPPEEVYLAFTPGEWWNAEMDWTEPGPGGVIYNPPGIVHAMRAGPSAFLAMWFLPVD